VIKHGSTAMATPTVHIGARFDADLVHEIDKSAAEDRRDRTGQLEYLTELGLAARRRLKELERRASASSPDHSHHSKEAEA